MKSLWPTLENRLSRAPVDDEDEIKLLEQLDKNHGLTKIGQRRLDKLRAKIKQKQDVK